MSFFKFVSEERIDILKNGCIRFTPASDFNDPFEFKPHITKINRKFLPLSIDFAPSSNLTKDELSKKYSHLSIDSEDEDLIHQYSSGRSHQYTEYKYKLEKIFSEYGVLSLFFNNAETFNPSVLIHDEDEPRQNILMWSHYANNHKGMVIEFDDSFFSEEISQVTYDTKRPWVTYEDIDELCDENLFKIFNTKKNVWNNESEWRVIKKLDTADTIIKTENENLIHLFKFNKKHIKSVTIGCNADPTFTDEIYKILKHDSELNHVAFFMAKIHEENFCLKFFQKMEMNGGTFSNAPLFEDMDILSTIPLQYPPETFNY